MMSPSPYQKFRKRLSPTAVILIIILGALLLSFARKSKKLPKMETSTPVLSTPNQELEKVSTTLYYPLADLTGLKSSSIDLPDLREHLLEWVSGLVFALSKPPGDDVQAVFASSEKVRSALLSSDGTLFIDFPSIMVDSRNRGLSSEVWAMKAFLKTLGVNVPKAKRVKILIDGDNREELFGHVDIRDPIELTVVRDTMP